MLGRDAKCHERLEARVRLSEDTMTVARDDTARGQRFAKIFRYGFVRGIFWNALHQLLNESEDLLRR